MILFLGFDLILSAYHYYHFSFDGDLTKIGTPILWYENVMNDPFGINAVTTKIEYGGAGRYFCHQYTVWWCKYGFNLVHSFIKDPVVSVYLMASLFAMLVHVMFLGISYVYIRLVRPMNGLLTLCCLCICTLFIQYGKYYHSIGIIDRSSSYIFFYAFPLLIFALYAYPFFKAYQTANYKLPTWIHLMLIPLTFIVSFSCALIQPIVFIIAILSSIFFIYLPKDSRWNQFLKSNHIRFHFLFLLAVCLYAFYVTQFNVEKTHINTLADRYFLLIKGIYYLFFYDTALIYMGIWIGINLFMLNKMNDASFKFYRNQLGLILLFSILYVGLLPFGGYRTYRPYIVRYDTFMPVTFALIYFIGITTIHILALNNTKYSKGYIGLIVLFIGIFTWVDRDLESNHNKEQKEVLYILHHSSDTLINMPRHCNVGTWSTTDYDDEQILVMLNKIFIQWEIIKPYQRVYVKALNQAIKNE